MRFDGTVTLGTVLSAVTFVLAFFVAYTKATAWLGEHLSRFDTTLKEHAAQLGKHAERMDRYEGRYVAIASDLQWLIGRMDGNRRRASDDHSQDAG